MAERSAPATRSTLREIVAIARPHILFVAMAAMLVFGWLTTGRYVWWLAPVVAADWFFVNLLNRVTDVAEDTKNGIVGTAFVARHQRTFTIAAFAAPLGSLVVTHGVAPWLSAPRLAVLLLGLGYSYRIVPTPGGLRRIKEIYAAKNLGSALIFVLTGFVYPIAVAGRIVPWSTVAMLVLFFVPFEITFEILYDLRDIDGDSAEGVPTFPVRHGKAGARRLIDMLLIASAVAIVVGLVTRSLGIREALMIAAPATQLLFYRPRFTRGIDARDCILATHLATAQLVAFLVGTAAWSRAGLPPNLFVR
jgi:4-hydroxybenzoate polyprenyltransferase